MAREGHDVLKPVEGPEPLRRQQARPEEDVLVREREQGSAVLVRHDALERRLRPRRTVDQGQPDEQRGCAPDAFQSAERVPPQLVPFPGLGDEHPGLPLLGEETDVEARRAVRRQIRHFDELSVAERSAILGAHYDRHEVSLPAALEAFPTGRTPPRAAAARPAYRHRRSPTGSATGVTASGQDRTLPEQPLQLADEPVATVHVELRRQPEDLGADV